MRLPGTGADPLPGVDPVPGTGADLAADGGWRRLHPLTPLLRGGRFVLVLLAVLGQQGLRQASPLLLAGVLGVGVPLAVLSGWLSWRAMRYRLTDTELQVESGVLTTRSRRVPLARLQSVDVVRPLLARLLGLAELRMEVVGGGAGAEAPLSYLAEDDAELLRARLLHLAAGGTAEAVRDDTDQRVLVVVPPGPLVWSTLLGAPATAVGLLVVALAVVSAVDLSYVPGLALGAVPPLFAVGSVAVRRVLTEYGFTVAEAADGLRLSQGLLDKRSSTIPPGRVQTVRVRQPLLWRPFGWVRVEVDVAGFAAGGGGEQQLATGALLPVAPRELGERLVARVLGGPLPVADVRPPAAARWRVPVSYRRLALGVDAGHLVSSYGLLAPTTDVVPLAKVQSLRLTQGPWQRALGLSSLHVDTAGRRLPGTVAVHRGADEGRQLLGDLAVRARTARGR